MAKAIKSLELHYPMIQFFIMLIIGQLRRSRLRAIPVAMIPWEKQLTGFYEYVGLRLTTLQANRAEVDA